MLLKLRIFYLLFILSLPCIAVGQVYFQLERAEITKVWRFSTGEELEFRTDDIDGWQRGIITQILPEAQTLVFDDAIVPLDEISHLKIKQPWAKAMGQTVMLFGSAWLVMGGTIEGLRSIDVIETDYVFGWDTAAIGVTAFVSGFLTQHFLGKVVRKINKRNRVRIIDLRP